jgi:hypothetical protein
MTPTDDVHVILQAFDALANDIESRVQAIRPLIAKYYVAPPSLLKELEALRDELHTDSLEQIRLSTRRLIRVYVEKLDDILTHAKEHKC